MNRTCRRGHARVVSRFQATLLGFALLWGGSVVAIAQSERSAPQPPPVGPYRIAGVVVNAKNSTPIAGASVQIQDVKNQESRRTVTASNDGRFEFRVMAGKFGLLGAKMGFTTSYYNAHEGFSSAIVTGAGLDTEHLALRLPPVAVLAGKVLDETGEPVRGAEVHVYRDDHSIGISRATSVGNAATDDQGSYEVTPLAEGTYFVAVHAAPWYAVHPLMGRDASVDRSLDVAYPITYYGDVTQADEATPIPIRGGDHVEADIHVTPAPAAHVTVHLDQERSQSPTVLAPTLDGPEEIRVVGRYISPNLYEMTGFAPGDYVVRMSDDSGELREPKEMQLSGGQELDNSSARPVGTVNVAVHMSNGGKLPGRLSLALRSANASRELEWQAVQATGRAEITDVAPGRYDLLAATNDRGYEVVSFQLGDERVSGKTFEVPAGASLEVKAYIIGGMTNVEGLAKRAGKPASGAMIVLVPENPEANRELFRRDQSDLDGTFTLQNVVPGSYTVVAIDDGWDLDWSRQPVLARYLAKGHPVKVSDKTQGSMHLSAPVEVQKK